MNNINKTKDDIILELLELQKEYNILKTAYKKEIAERVNLENSFKDNERKSNLLIETMNEGLMYVDNDDVIIFVNKSICKMFGYEKDELVGKVGLETIIYQEDKEIIRQKNASRIDKNADSYQVRGIKKNGELIWLMISGAPVTNENNITIGSVGLLSDITVQKKAQDELQASEEKWRSIVNTSLYGVAIVSLNGVIEYISDKTVNMLKYSDANEMLNRNMFEFLDPIYYEKATILIQEMLNGNYTGATDYLLLKSDGEKVAIEINAEVIKDKMDKVKNILLILKDITEQRKVEETLKKNDDKFLRVFNLISLPLLIFNKSTDCLTDVNNAFLNCFGFNREDVIGKSIIETKVLALDILNQFKILLNDKGFFSDVKIILVVY